MTNEPKENAQQQNGLKRNTKNHDLVDYCQKAVDQAIPPDTSSINPSNNAPQSGLKRTEKINNLVDYCKKNDDNAASTASRQNHITQSDVVDAENDENVRRATFFVASPSYISRRNCQREAVFKLCQKN